MNYRFNKCLTVFEKYMAALFVFSLLLKGIAIAETGRVQIEKSIHNDTASEAFQKFQVDSRCHTKSTYRVYSALDQSGQRLPGFPYSPLSSGDEPAFYTILECPHPEDPFMAVLDFNGDGYQDYTFFRTGKIAHRNDFGELAFAPPVTPQNEFAAWLAQIKTDPDCGINQEIVLTAAQYRELKRVCPAVFGFAASKSYVWLNSAEHGLAYDF